MQLCGTEGAKPGVCWYGSPTSRSRSPRDVSTEVALTVLERREDYPGRQRRPGGAYANTRPRADANAAHMLGYIGPVLDTDIEKSEVPATVPVLLRQRRDRQGRSRAGRTTSYLRGMPGVKQLAVDKGGNVTGTVGETDPTAGNYLVTSIDARVQAVAEQALATAIMAAAGRGHVRGASPHKADSGAVVVMDVKTGRIVAMASLPHLRPRHLGRGHLAEAVRPAHEQEGQHPADLAGDEAGFAPASTFKVVSTAAAAKAGYNLNGTYPCPATYQVGNVEQVQLRVRRLRRHHAQARPRGLVQHGLLQAGLRDLAARRRQRPQGPTKEYFVNMAKGVRLRLQDRHRPPVGDRRAPIVSRADKQSKYDELKDSGASGARRATPRRRTRSGRSTSRTSRRRTASTAGSTAVVTRSTSPSGRATPS